MAYQSDVTEEMILLMRGFFSMPVISNLGRLGILDSLLTSGQISVDDCTHVSNKDVLLKSFQYLSRIGLLEKGEGGNKYQATDLGREVFRRHSSFYVPHSYHEYMNSFQDLLENESLNLSEGVNRLENVVGSGTTHQRYFFPAVSFLKRKINFDIIVDIGCGNGSFLKEALKGLADKRAVGIDLSEISVNVTGENLKKEYPGREITMICSDAFDLDNWGNKLKRIAGEDQLVISMWFLIHEISQNDPNIIIKYLKDIYSLFPKAKIMIGELVRHSENILSEQRTKSIMPEYLFFHDLSGQGILSWEDYQNILDHIPYKVLTERVFDELPSGDGTYVPSAFIWCLEPE